jgi:hypothetical protein
VVLLPKKEDSDMANHDVYYDVTPQMVYKKVKSPRISSLRTALTAYNGTYFTAARLDGMLNNDMEYAARLAGLVVVNPT